MPRVKQQERKMHDCLILDHENPLTQSFDSKELSIKKNLSLPQSCSVILANDLSRSIPALLTTISIRPKLSIAVLTIASPFSTES